VISGAAKSDFICIAGSAFLVAEMRPLALLPGDLTERHSATQA
jgi:hypothetical protein